MSRALFLHHNFPAQFRFLALSLADLGHEVVFLSERNNIGALSSVRQISVLDKNNQYKNASFQGQISCAERFRQALIDLRNEGWYPDVIVSHSGWGCGLHVSEIFPKARQIVYVEWWFANNSADYTFDPDNAWWSYSNKLASSFVVKFTLALELAEADVVAPTLWQKNQLPESFSRVVWSYMKVLIPITSS